MGRACRFCGFEPFPECPRVSTALNQTGTALNDANGAPGVVESRTWTILGVVAFALLGCCLLTFIVCRWLSIHHSKRAEADDEEAVEAESGTRRRLDAIVGAVMGTSTNLPSVGEAKKIDERRGSVKNFFENRGSLAYQQRKSFHIDRLAEAEVSEKPPSARNGNRRGSGATTTRTLNTERERRGLAERSAPPALSSRNRAKVSEVDEEASEEAVYLALPNQARNQPKRVVFDDVNERVLGHDEEEPPAAPLEQAASLSTQLAQLLEGEQQQLSQALSAREMAMARTLMNKLSKTKGVPEVGAAGPSPSEVAAVRSRCHLPAPVQLPEPGTACSTSEQVFLTLAPKSAQSATPQPPSPNLSRNVSFDESYTPAGLARPTGLRAAGQPLPAGRAMPTAAHSLPAAPAALTREPTFDEKIYMPLAKEKSRRRGSPSSSRSNSITNLFAPPPPSAPAKPAPPSVPPPPSAPVKPVETNASSTSNENAEQTYTTRVTLKMRVEADMKSAPAGEMPANTHVHVREWRTLPDGTRRAHVCEVGSSPEKSGWISCVAKDRRETLVPTTAESTTAPAPNAPTGGSSAMRPAVLGSKGREPSFRL